MFKRCLNQADTVIDSQKLRIGLENGLTHQMEASLQTEHFMTNSPPLGLTTTFSQTLNFVVASDT